MFKQGLWLLLMLVCVACANSSNTATSAKAKRKQAKFVELRQRVISAEDHASPVGKKILKTGRLMVFKTKEIVRGSCWDYIHKVYNRSGYPQAKRHYIMRGKKSKGPYAKPDAIQPGDWLYYINHSYHGVEHSGIFIRWVNKSKRIGLILSYGGERRKKPGRYRNYDLSNVYTIIRAKH